MCGIVLFFTNCQQQILSLGDFR